MVSLAAALVLVQAVAAAPSEPIRIEVPLPIISPRDLDFFLQCARAYEQLHPGVVVDLYGDLRISNKVRIRLLEGAVPEITYATGMDYSKLIRGGQVLPLNNYLDGPAWDGAGTWRDSFLPGTLNGYVYDGQVFGVPLMYSVSAFWYNRELFEKHGWAVPETWPQFLELCKSVKAAGLAPIAFQGRQPASIRALIEHLYYHRAGRDEFFHQQQLIPGSFNNPRFIRALTDVQHLALNYFQPGAMGMSFAEAEQMFFRGDAAMILSGPWLAQSIEMNAPPGFNYGIFPMPLPVAPHADPEAVRVYTVHFFVMSQSAHPEVGIDFLRFMTSAEMAAAYVRRQQIPAAIHGVNRENLRPEMSDMVRMIEAAKRTFGDSSGTTYLVMNQPWSDERAKLLTGSASPETIAKNLELAAEAARAQMSDPDRVLVRHLKKTAVFVGLVTVILSITAIEAWRRRRGNVVRVGRRISIAAVTAFLGPAVGLYVLFMVIPCATSLAWCVQRWDGITPPQYVGLLHFRRLLLESDHFWSALKNNLFIMFSVPLFVLPLALFFSACISRGVKGARFFQVVFFFPNVLGIVTILIWQQLYNPAGGPVNRILVAMGFERFDHFPWLSQDNLYWALIPMFVWGACGFHMILYLAAMQNVPVHLYEAATIDGASPWRQFWSVTIPMIWDVLAISMIFMLIAGMKTFEAIWLLTDQYPTTTTHVIGTRMVTSMFIDFNIGEAASLAVLLFVIVLCGVAMTSRLTRRESPAI